MNANQDATARPGKTVNRIKQFIFEHGFDFINLFMAVSLGFFVDNFREDYTGNKTAKDLASDMISDIATDTMAMHAMIREASYKSYKLDSLSFLLRDDALSMNDSLVYRYSSVIDHRSIFEISEGSYTLLINSGYLRYLSKNVSTAITRYKIESEKTIEILKQERYLLSSKIFPFLQQVFHTENFKSIINQQSMSVKPVLHNWTQENRWLFHNYVEEMKITNESIIKHFRRLMSNAKVTLLVLEKETV